MHLSLSDYMKIVDRTNVAPTATATFLAGMPTMDEENFRGAFCRNRDGSWTCVEAAELYTAVGRIQVTEGSTFYRGTTFMGFDLASWLEERLGDTGARCEDSNPAQAARKGTGN